MMAGGASMMISGWQGSGVGNWAQSIGGGALTGLAIGGPIGALIGGGVGAIGKLIDAISGPNSYEAGSKEVTRDFGGIKYSDKEVQAMYNRMGRLGRISCCFSSRSMRLAIVRASDRR
jgi:hypothetical protein